MSDEQIADTVAVEEYPEKWMTTNCVEGRHDVCRCLLPGQNPEWAGLIAGWNEDLECFYPAGICACECHAQDGPVVP